MKTVLLIAALLFLGARLAQADPLIPTDAALSFVALGGGVAGGLSLAYDLADSSPAEPAWMKLWWWRLPAEAAQAWAIGAGAQALAGSIPTRARILGYGNWAALGAFGAFTISYGAGGVNAKLF